MTQSSKETTDKKTQENKLAKPEDAIVANKEDVKLTPATIDNFKFNSVKQLLDFGAEIVKSRLTPLKKPEDVMVAILTGRELGFGTMTSVSYIYPIEGRASLSIHLITAKLYRAGVTFQVINDFVNVYRYYNKHGAYFSEEDILNYPEKFEIITKESDPAKYDKEKTQIMREKVDVKTTIKMRRKVKQPDDTWVDTEITHSMLWSDAVKMGWTTKDNWEKQPKNMLRIRTIDATSKLIAPDLRMSIPETSSMADVAGIDYEIDETGDITILEETEHVGDAQEVEAEVVEKSNVQTTSES